MAKKAATEKDSVKKKPTMRESVAKSQARAEKPRRIRRAANAAGKPVSAVGTFMTKERHVIPRNNPDTFFTKSRSLAPRFLKNAWKELRQVTWPGRRDTWRLVFAVFVFAVVMGATISLLDYGLEKLLREVIL